MKTKLIFPWKLRIGQKIISSNILGQKHVNKIISIKKRSGIFTGKSVWDVFVKNENDVFGRFSFHAKSKYLKLQKAEIVID